MSTKLAKIPETVTVTMVLYSPLSIGDYYTIESYVGIVTGSHWYLHKTPFAPVAMAGTANLQVSNFPAQGILTTSSTLGPVSYSISTFGGVGSSELNLRSNPSDLFVSVNSTVEARYYKSNSVVPNTTLSLSYPTGFQLYDNTFSISFFSDDFSCLIDGYTKSLGQLQYSNRDYHEFLNFLGSSKGLK